MTESPKEYFKNGTEVPPESAEARRRRERQELRERQAADAQKKPRGRRCQVCLHPERQRIEALHVTGVGIDKLADRFGVHRDSIWRHMQRHVSEEAKASYLIGPGRVAQLAEVAAEENGSLLDYLKILRSTLFGLLDKRAAEGDDQAVGVLSQRALNTLREIGRITGEITSFASSTTINITNNMAVMNSGPFVDLQSGLMRISVKHPAARADILALIHDLDARYSEPQTKMIEAEAAE